MLWTGAAVRTRVRGKKLPACIDKAVIFFFFYFPVQDADEGTMRTKGRFNSCIGSIIAMACVCMAEDDDGKLFAA